MCTLTRFLRCNQSRTPTAIFAHRHDMTPIMCPTLLVAAQYDEFRTQDAPRRKPVLNALRYIAHVYGAAFMCTSTKEKATISNFKAWMNTALFRASPPSFTPDLSPANAVLAPEGSDTFAQIGPPPGASSPPPPSAVDVCVGAWTTAVSAVWSAPEGAADDAADIAEQVAQHDEPVVDAARQAKEYVHHAARTCTGTHPFVFAVRSWTGISAMQSAALGRRQKPPPESTKAPPAAQQAARNEQLRHRGVGHSAHRTPHAPVPPPLPP